MRVLSLYGKTLRLVFSERKHQAIGTVTFMAAFSGYAFVLPSTFTGGRVGLVSFRLITPTQILFSAILAILLALIASFVVYTSTIELETGASTAGGLMGSILPPLLCCSPLLPVLAGFLSGFAPVLAGRTRWLQGFLVIHETKILSAAAFIMAYSAHRTIKSVGECDRCQVRAAEDTGLENQETLEKS